MPTVPSSRRMVSIDPTLSRGGTIPGAVPGAFGEREAQAQAAVGKSLFGVADVAKNIAAISARLTQNKINEQKADITNQYITGMQDMMFNPEEETYTDSNGVSRTRPKGFLMQYGYQTEGLMDRMLPTEMKVRQELLKDVTNKVQARELNAIFERQFLSIRQNSIKHQVTQLRKAAQENFGSTRKNLIDAATGSLDAKSLIASFENIRNNNHDEVNRFGLSKDDLDAQNNEDFAQAAKNAATNMLIQTGDLSQAKELLAQVKDYLQVDDFNSIVKDLDTMSKTIKEKIDDDLLKSQTENEGGILQRALSKDLTLAEIDDMHANGSISLGIAKISTEISAMLDKEMVKKSDNKALIALWEKYLLLPAEDLKKMQDYRVLVGAKVKGKKLSKKDALLLINRTIDPLNPVAQQKKDWFEKAWGIFESIAEAMPDPAIMLSEMINDFVVKLDNNGISEENIDEETKKIIQDERKTINPLIVTTDEEGTLMMDAFGNKAIVYPDGRIKEID